MNRKYDKIDFQRPRSEKKLPKIIDRNFLKCRIDKIENIKHKAIIIEKIKEGLYTLQDLEHGLEACGETPEDCMKNLELALKAFEIYDKIKKEEEK